MPSAIVAAQLPLLGVVVDELFEVGLDELDFGEDLVRGGGPFERRGGGSLPILNVPCAWRGLTAINESTGSFAVQPTWSNAVRGCATSA